MSRALIRRPSDASYLSVNWGSPVNWNHGINRGLQAWWLNVPGFTGGTSWVDIARGHVGTLTNMDPATDWEGPGDRPGGWGALRTDATSEYVNVPFSERLHFLGSFTFTAWIVPISDSTSDNLAVHVGSAGSEAQAENFNFRLRIRAGGDMGYLHEYNNGTNQGEDTVNTNMPLNEWSHCAWVRDDVAKTVTVYVNGLADSDVFTYTNSTNGGENGNLTLSWNTSESFDGYLDDARFWDRPLSAVEMHERYVNSQQGYPGLLNRWGHRAWSTQVAPPAGGRIMSSLANRGGLAGAGGIAGPGGGLAA